MKQPIIYLTNFFFFLLLVEGLLAQPEIPIGLQATAYDSHIELEWQANPEPNINRYRIYVSKDEGVTYELLKTVNDFPTTYIDFVGEQNVSRLYKITAQNTLLQESDSSQAVRATTFAMSDDELLDMVQAYTFRYFWDFGHPVSGLARERNTTGTVTMGGSGFGVAAILVGIERGFITWEEGLQRLQKIVNFLENADRFHGVFPHWMNGATGSVIPFSARDNGGDLVETAFLMQGLLTVRQYFDGNSPAEQELRNKITNLWEAVEWDWHLRNGVLLWHWSPTNGFEINLPIRGYNESLIVYLLAIASPTHAIPASIYHTGWAGGNYENGTTFFGVKLDVGPLRGGPLFFAHYSYMGFDPRGKKDQYTNYFAHNRNHTLLNRAYCILNPEDHEGYSEVCWGLTASDDPIQGYLAHEASPNRDNGTLTPTAALSSMPYTPAESMAALRHFYRDLGAELWGRYGFYDAFNLSLDWYADSYLAIDQGPIIGMIENYRSELLWNNFMKNPELEPALEAIGFEPDSTVILAVKNISPSITINISPNPTANRILLEVESDQLTFLQLQLLNVEGKVMWQRGNFPVANKEELDFSNLNLPDGVYFLRIQSVNKKWQTNRKIVIQQ